MSICLEMRSRICGKVWSMAFSVTFPSIPGPMSILILASRARANRISRAGTLVTTTLYVSTLGAGLGGGRTTETLLGRGMSVTVAGAASLCWRCLSEGAKDLVLHAASETQAEHNSA